MPCPTLAMWSWRCAGQSRPRHPVRFRNTGIALSHSSPQPHLMIVIHSLSGGGAERVAADLSAYWVQRGYKVTLVTQRSEEHTSELQSLMRISYACFCLKK